VWLGHHRSIKPPGLFALYVTGYSAFRIFEEALRVDPSEHFLGLRLNTYVATILTIVGIVWFWRSQRRRPAPARPDGQGPTAGGTGSAQAAPGGSTKVGAGPAGPATGPAEPGTGATGATAGDRT